MSIPGFTADPVTYRGGGGYRSGPGAPPRRRPGVLPQGRAARRTGGEAACARLCLNRCWMSCRNPHSEQCDVCTSDCLDWCSDSPVGAGLF